MIGNLNNGIKVKNLRRNFHLFVINSHHSKKFLLLWSSNLRSCKMLLIHTLRRNLQYQVWEVHLKLSQRLFPNKSIKIHLPSLLFHQVMTPQNSCKNSVKIELEDKIISNCQWVVAKIIMQLNL